MANFIHRTTLEYVESGHTPDYPVEDWIKNPNLSSVTGVPTRYWKTDGDNVVEMSQGEKDTVDANLEAARIARLEQTNVKKEGFVKGREFFELTLETNKWTRHKKSVMFNKEFITPPNLTTSNVVFDSTANLNIVKVSEIGFEYEIEARGTRGRGGLTSVAFDWEAIL